MAWRPLSSSTSSSQCQTLVPPGLGQPGNVLRALKVHVRGFVLKDAPADALATAVRRVSNGERVIDPELVAAALATGSTPPTTPEADVLRAAPSGFRQTKMGSGFLCDQLRFATN